MLSQLDCVYDYYRSQLIVCICLVGAVSIVYADDDYDSETGDGFHPSAYEDRLNRRRQIQFEFDDVSLQEHVSYHCCNYCCDVVLCLFMTTIRDVVINVFVTKSTNIAGI